MSKENTKDRLDEDLQESFPFLDEMAETEVTGMNRNPKGAGIIAFGKIAKNCSISIKTPDQDTQFCIRGWLIVQ